MKRKLWLLAIAAACSHEAIFAGQINPSTKPAETVYTLHNKFGTIISVYPHEGYYLVEQLAPGAAGSLVNISEEQAWFGRGIVSLQAGHKWFRSASLQLYHTSDPRLNVSPPASTSAGEGKLVLTNSQTGSGNDRFGEYDSIQLDWSVPALKLRLTTVFTLYRDRPFLTFTQRLPDGFAHYASGDWTVPSVAFPHFLAPNWGTPQNLTSWTSGGMWNHRLAYGDAYSLQGTVEPLVVSDPGYRTVILSPFDHYLVSTQQSKPIGMIDAVSKGSISCGIEGLVEAIPPGFEHRTIMVAGQGIHDTFIAWGKALLERGGKQMPSKYQDDTLKYLVYMDDAGAYYYEHDFHEDGYKTYADVILAIEKEAKEHDLRIGAYHILDDRQQRDRDEGLFEPRRDLFPEGLAAFQKQLAKPLQLYMMWIKPGGPYRSKYAFFATDPGEIPMSMGDVFYTPQYWADTANKLASWGTILLQHDFLSDYEGNVAMMSGLDKMDVYFRNMATALQKKGIDMQYCMALPRNILQSTENPIMVSLQATDDHHVPMAEPKKEPANPDNHDPYFWKHVIFTSAFYGAVGIWPSRDNIQTVADPNAFEDVLVANLLAGSIQLGHRLGECNFNLLKKTYREADGLILKPDRPITPIDRCYKESCSVGYTASSHGARTWYYVLSLPAAGYTRYFSPSDVGANANMAVYDWDNGVVSIKSPESIIDLQREAKHQYFVVAPVFHNGMAVIGDTSKFITMADGRVEAVDARGKSLHVSVVASARGNAIITGYAPARPPSVSRDGRQLEEVSSLERLERAHSGWFWDYQTKMWHVKLDWSNSSELATKSFDIEAE